MSIKNLFNKKQASFENATSGSSRVESSEFIIKSDEKKQTFIPNINFNSASNFAKFGSAYEYYTSAIERVYNEYPYDGSEKEKIIFELSSSYLDKWVFDNHYPKSTGYINFSNGGWGSLNGSITSDGYGLPTSTEYIYARGGLHTASAGMAGKPLHKTFDKSVVYDSDNGRTTTFKVNTDTGFTVEFWLKKDSFDVAKTKKEVILDLWNGENSSSADYGRFTLELSGTGVSEAGTDTFRLSLQSGTNGFFDQAIGTTSVTTGSLSSWKHYAFSFVSGGSGVVSRLYVDGTLNEKKTLGSVGTIAASGLVNGYIGALQASPSSSNGTYTQEQLKYYGKLDASVDDFRFWNIKRTSEQVYNNFYTHVGGGTNTDDANINLGLYYKFNEGVVGNSSFDSVVLDYSGRIANGSWTGYSAGSRNTGSAFVSSSIVSSEPTDPIIRSTHPDVTTLLTNLQASGSEWDSQNTSMLYNRIPGWIREEDEDDNKNVKYLFQIMASYFDSLHAQITHIPKLKEKTFYQDEYKPLPFADRLLQEKGLVTSNILVNRGLFETYNKRDTNKVLYEREIEEVKNLIYTNIYNNLEYIYKSKGTESSIRNMLRCFGVDDEIVKLNVYTDEGTHYFNDNFKETVINKNYINFNTVNNFGATVFQTASTNNSETFVTGSKTSLSEIYSAFSSEVNIIVPYKLQSHEAGYFTTNFLSSSIFGAHEAANDPADYTWNTTEYANFEVYLVRDKVESKKAQFVLTNRDGSLFLTSSFIRDIYDNQSWNLAVRVKPDKYPFIGNVVTSSNPTYTIDFYGVNHAFSTVDHEFHVSASLTYASGSGFLTNPKRFYVGAHKTNFTGSTLNSSDIKVGSLNSYLEYASNDTIKQHNLDPTNYGLKDSFSTPTMFGNGHENRQIPSFDTKILIWNFATVTGSDSSGNFTVDDFSSGSTSFTYDFPDKITKAYHAGQGFGFAASDTALVKSEQAYASKKELPEISYTSNNITIENDDQKYLIKEDDVSDSFFSLEKSMYQVVSEEMLNMFSSVKEFSNLIGKATDRYRIEYKRLNFIRSLFFDKVETDMDFDRFTSYFKWIDDSVSQFVSQLFPVSARNSKEISDMVESHILERNKYQNKFPILTTHPSTEGTVRGGRELAYNWKTGHAPVDATAENTNCTWQRQRKERTDITQREDIRKIITSETSASVPTFSQTDGTIYQGSAYALRKLSRPYKISQDLKPAVHGGINYPPKKDRDIIYHLAQRHGDKGNYGQPLNTVVAGAGSGSGIVEQQKCDDVINPNLKKRVNLDVYVGRYSNGAYTPQVRSESDTYTYRLSELEIPVTVISQSVNSGYNTAVVNGFDSGSIVTNIHSDTTTPGNYIPMQGPFTQAWVGGHQHRHVEVNRYDTSLIDDDLGIAPPNNLDNKYTRPEGWRLALGDYINNDGAIGIVGPDYGGPYPDPARKVAVFYREERAKRPVNVKNIQYTTASRNLGNYKENYEVVSATGKLQNNLYLRKNPDISNYMPPGVPAGLTGSTTNVLTLVGKIADSTRLGNIFGSNSNLKDETDYESTKNNELLNSNRNRTIITSRFSAPGGIETSFSYLDVHSREYSVHNSLNYRNLTVRGKSSGEAGTIRLNDHIGNRDGLRTHISRHSGRFGRDSVYGDIVATSFPKSDSHVLVDNETILWFNLIGSQNGTGQSTHSAWVKVNNLDASHYIFDYGDDKFSAYVNTSGRVVINTEGWTITDRSYFTSTAPITAGQFHHVAIVFNTASSPQPTFYVDGVATGTSKIGTDAAGLFQPTDGLTIGAKNKGASNSIDGSIDEFAVWGTEFSSIQIKNIYEAGRGSALNTIGVNPYDNLELWYSMGDEDDSVHQLYDKSGNGRHSFNAKNINFEVSDDVSPSLVKQHRNRSIRPTDQGSLLVPVLKNSYDNGFVTSPIPRTEYQYSWIKDSLGSNYSVIQGKQRLYGYAPADGILSSSVSIGGESGFVAAINFPTASEIFGV